MNPSALLHKLADRQPALSTNSWAVWKVMWRSLSDPVLGSPWPQVRASRSSLRSRVCEVRRYGTRQRPAPIETLTVVLGRTAMVPAAGYWLGQKTSVRSASSVHAASSAIDER